MAAPTDEHFLAAKHLGRYIRGSTNRGLTYHKREKGEKLLTYAYSDASLMNSRPISGVVVYLGTPDRETHKNKNAAVIAYTKKEATVTNSTMHAELLALDRAVTACKWVADLREELGVPQEEAAVIFTDSRVGIRFLQEDGAVPNKQTRHLRRHFNHIKQALARGEIKIEFVSSKLNRADMLSKAMDSKDTHEDHSRNMMGS